MWWLDNAINILRSNLRNSSNTHNQTVLHKFIIYPSTATDKIQNSWSRSSPHETLIILALIASGFLSISTKKICFKMLTFIWRTKNHDEGLKKTPPSSSSFGRAHMYDQVFQPWRWAMKGSMKFLQQIQTQFVGAMAIFRL